MFDTREIRLLSSNQIYRELIKTVVCLAELPLAAVARRFASEMVTTHLRRKRTDGGQADRRAGSTADQRVLYPCMTALVIFCPCACPLFSF